MRSYIDRRVTICMLLVALTLLGYFSYKQLPVELLPNTEMPQLYVRASAQADLTPSYMEQQVIIPLEGAISAVGGVENMESTVSGRQGTITVDFKRGTNLKMTTVKLQEKINSIRSDFPTGVTVNVQQANLTGISNQFMSLQVRGSGGVDRLRAIVDKDVVPRLESIDGIAGVTVYGGRAKSIEIRSNPEAMKALNISRSGYICTSFSLLMMSSASTCSARAATPVMAFRIFFSPSNWKGIVTIPTVRIPSFCASSAMIAEAPVPVPPPIVAA